MDKRVSKTSKIAATILLVLNMFVMVFSCFLFALGLWTIVSSSSLARAIQFTGIPAMKALLPPEVLTIQLGVAVAVLATFLFFVSFMGFYGAVSRSQFLLFMYSTLVLLLLLLECALIYYFSSSLVEKGLQEDDGQWNHALRLAFSCCDRNNTFSNSSVVLLRFCCLSKQLHNWKHSKEAPLSSSPPRKRSWHLARVSPGVEHTSDDVLMLVVGRGRIGWVEQKP